jgi:GAF domain-containing protein
LEEYPDSQGESSCRILSNQGNSPIEARSDTPLILWNLIDSSLREGKPFRVKDANLDPRCHRERVGIMYNVQTAMSIPLRRGGGITRVLLLDRKIARDPFTPEDGQVAFWLFSAHGAALDLLERTP